MNSGCEKIKDGKKWGGGRLATPPHREGSLTSTYRDEFSFDDLFTRCRNHGANAYATARKGGCTLH